jgi:hypothetical protein
LSVDAPWPTGGGDSYPQYPNPDREDVNRDMNVRFVNNPAAVGLDWARGSDFVPK